jgi:hypothetical protein
MDHILGYALIIGFIVGIIQIIREPRQTEAEGLKEEWFGW